MIQRDREIPPIPLALATRDPTDDVDPGVKDLVQTGQAQ